MEGIGKIEAVSKRAKIDVQLEEISELLYGIEEERASIKSAVNRIDDSDISPSMGEICSDGKAKIPSIIERLDFIINRLKEHGDELSKIKNKINNLV